MGSRCRSASRAVDLPSDGGANLERLFAVVLYRSVAGRSVDSTFSIAVSTPTRGCRLEFCRNGGHSDRADVRSARSNIQIYDAHTHRVAIANSRLIACDRANVTFRWKNYRAEGRDSQKVMTLATGEFIRRFLIHVLPHGFHRIRHYGLLASGTRAHDVDRARRLLDVPAEQPEVCDDSRAEDAEPLSQPCPCCGGRMVSIETFQRGSSPRTRPAASTTAIRIDTS
jgi:hypothetical protein